MPNFVYIYSFFINRKVKSLFLNNLLSTSTECSKNSYHTCLPRPSCGSYKRDCNWSLWSCSGNSRTRKTIVIIIHTYALDVVHKVECPPYQETGFLVCGNCMFNWLAGSCVLSLSLSLFPRNYGYMETIIIIIIVVFWIVHHFWDSFGQLLLDSVIYIFNLQKINTALIILNKNFGEREQKMRIP